MDLSQRGKLSPDLFAPAPCRGAGQPVGLLGRAGRTAGGHCQPVAPPGPHLVRRDRPLFDRTVGPGHELLAGLQLPLSPLISPVAGLLGTTAPILDDLLSNLTAILGVKLGTATVKVHQMRCGMPTLVA